MTNTCPSCKQKSDNVSNLALQSHLKTNLNDLKGTFFVCTTQKCQIVYFSTQLKQQFTKNDIHTRFGLKESLNPRPICYCFNHSIQDIETQLKTSKNCDIIEQIKSSMKLSGCNCEIKNPIGKCCLNTIKKIIQKINPDYNTNIKQCCLKKEDS
ncbi:MAG: hypothetical protein COB02_00205 [Candidatus Cloacimonadota bacterium]|nr:MAG: hypothetical protein COB02_04340 [Candidatus Cloacimonadota bacterium]PCJ21045.1 MAG: hypothetical protein COB02_00205 [Candidatus Cloacimonadota bacterium]